MCTLCPAFEKDRTLDRFIPRKRITIPNAPEEAFVISSGTCSFIKISPSVFAIPFLPVNSPRFFLERVPFIRHRRTARIVHVAVTSPFFRVTTSHFSSDPVRGRFNEPASNWRITISVYLKRRDNNAKSFRNALQGIFPLIAMTSLCILLAFRMTKRNGYQSVRETAAALQSPGLG